MPTVSISKAFSWRSLSLLFGFVGLVQANTGTLLTQSFFFDWNPPTQPYPFPVTEQCSQINIVWQRGAATGPNNVPPYFLQIYTSIHNSPILISAGDTLKYDFTVPFPPGTLYQICMFDKNGNTGGCQATYAVIPPRNSNNPPVCPNVTTLPQLDVEGTVNNGPISRYGWIDQCSDIELLPKNGTPPYTMTVAPALHPPYNITVSTMSAVNWTVALTWASPFFISLTDSTGASWIAGLLHSGGPGTSECLLGNTTVKHSNDIKPAVAVGSGIGGLVLGVLLGLGAMFLLMGRKVKELREERLLDLASDQYRAVPHDSIGSGNNQYHVEPFVLPSDGTRTQLSGSGSAPTTTRPTRAMSSDTGSITGVGAARPQNAVYVVHHDSQAPPVTIYHEDGTQIVELPPRYPDGQRPANQPPASQTSSDDRDARSDGGRTDTTTQELPTFLQQNRRPQQTRKPGRDLPQTPYHS